MKKIRPISILEKPVLVETKAIRSRVKSIKEHLESGSKKNDAKKPQNYSSKRNDVIDNWNISDVDMNVGKEAFEITGSTRYFSHTKAERTTSETHSRLF